jgi:uncharacterized protein YlxW (UPF0749 family)
VLPAIVLVLGFLVSAAVVQERAQEARLPAQTRDLVDLVIRRQHTIRELAGQVRSLSDELAGAQEAGARESERVREVVSRVERLRAPAGLEGLRGPGIVVELSDSPDAPRTRGDVTDLRIQDVDLQLVANALWAAGAEALAVNGHRIGGTTAIREAGDAVLVNFRAVSSPYRVTALGDPEALRRRLLGSDIARRFEVWTQIYGLGFSIGRADAVTVPGLPPSSAPGWAHPVGEGSS